MKNLYKAMAYILGGVVAVWLGVKILLPVGLPFLFGWLLSRMSTPATKRIANRVKLPYAVISFACLSVLAALLVLLLWLVAQAVLYEIELLAQKLPQLLSSLSQPLKLLEQRLLIFAQRLPDGIGIAVQQWVEKLFAGSSVVLSSASQWLLGVATGIISKVPDLFLFLLTMVLSAYLFAAQTPNIKYFFEKHVPPQWFQKLKTVTARLKLAFGGYLKTQMKLSLVTFCIVLVGLLLLRRRNALLLAALTALIDALPIFGAGTILIPWSIFSFLSGKSGIAAGLLMTYAAAALTRAVLEPRILGKQIGLSPLLTLIALYAGYRLCGFVGMILFPVAAILTKQLYDLVESTQT